MPIALDETTQAKFASLVRDIEEQIVALGLWTETCPPLQGRAWYRGQRFNVWLQHVYLPAVRRFFTEGALGQVPATRVGIAALREYDHMSYLAGSGPLITACRQIDIALERHPGAYGEDPW